MTISDHVAILAHHALARAIPNKKKQNRMEFYAVLAFPPAAMDALADAVNVVYPGADLSQISVSIRTNQQQTKPIVGIPADWLIVRAATQYQPYLADEAGNQMNDENHIRSVLYAGANVRVDLSAFSWTQDGVPGASFNVNGVMAAGAGERLSIGSGRVANNLAQYANPNATSTTHGANAQTVANGPTGNPFAKRQAAGAEAARAALGDGAKANPFAQRGAATGAAPGASPFGGARTPQTQQRTAGQTNPFVRGATAQGQGTARPATGFDDMDDDIPY